jgi:hypothetical protein
MKSRKHQRLKRNPLVRFIRGVFRLFRVIFKPKHRNLRSLQDKQSDLSQVELDRRQPIPGIEQRNLELDFRQRGQFITVGELFEQIKWQMPAETVDRANISGLSIKPQFDDVSRN